MLQVDSLPAELPGKPLSMQSRMQRPETFWPGEPVVMGVVFIGFFFNISCCFVKGELWKLVVHKLEYTVPSAPKL